MNIVCARDTDCPYDIIRLMRETQAEGVAANPEMMQKLEGLRHFITKKPLLDCRLKLPLLYDSAVIRDEHVKVHWLPFTTNIKGERTALTWDRTLKVNVEREKTQVDLRVGLTDREMGKCFTAIDGGVTGYESVYLTAEFVESTSKSGWSACAGGMGWDRLFIPADQMAKAHKELNSNVYANSTA